MLAIDEDLPHGPAAAGAPDHLVAPPRLLHDVDLGETHPFTFEQRAGMRAVGAPHGAVHLDLGHRAASPKNASSRVTGLRYGAASAIGQSQLPVCKPAAPCHHQQLPSAAASAAADLRQAARSSQPSASMNWAQR